MRIVILIFCLNVFSLAQGEVAGRSSVPPLGQDRVIVSQGALKKIGTLLEVEHPIPLASNLKVFLGEHRDEVRLALRRVTDEHLRGIGDGDVTMFGISPNQAVSLLVAMGDDATMGRLTEKIRNREVDWGRDAERWLKQSGQMEIIPHLGSLLMIDEPADKLLLPPSADAELADRPSIVACRLIAATLSETNEVEESVNEWARRMLEYEGSDRKSFREFFRQWWISNEKCFGPPDYSSIRPGSTFSWMIKSGAAGGITVGGDAPQIDGNMVGRPDATVPDRQTHPNLVAVIAIALSVILLGWMIRRYLRTSGDR